jgi:ElaA protein
MKSIRYTYKTFDQLTLDELYAILRLRQEVFVVEQNCPYLDLDNRDQDSWHVLGKDVGDTIHTYTRLIPKGVSYENYVSIGRVLNSSSVRGQGEGKKLMQYSIDILKSLCPNIPIKIGAQAYLKKFYQDFGFIDVEMPFVEDGIPHLVMILK